MAAAGGKAGRMEVGRMEDRRKRIREKKK